MEAKSTLGKQDAAREHKPLNAVELNSVSGGTFKLLESLHKMNPNTAQGVWVREVVEDVEAY